MNLTDIFNAKAIALHRTEVASNAIPYLGEGFFPVQKKMGLDLKWIKANKGLPVALAPSNFDAKSTLRARAGFKVEETEMPFFRESMLVKEKDEQEIMRVQDANDPYALEVLNDIYNDVDTLVNAADVIPELMRMQLLAPTVDGSPRITITSGDVQYSYNYDPDETYQDNNYEALTSTDKWDDFDDSDPMGDILNALDTVEAATGVRPSIMLCNNSVMALLKKNDSIKSLITNAGNLGVFITNERINQLFQTELGVTIVVYNKQYKDYSGDPQKFYPDNYITLLPEGSLGNTWFGVTPEERTLMGSKTSDVAIVGGGVAVAVTVSEDPVNTKTTVSEIVLPSYERMDETYVIKVA